MCTHLSTYNTNNISLRHLSQWTIINGNNIATTSYVIISRRVTDDDDDDDDSRLLHKKLKPYNNLLYSVKKEGGRRKQCSGWTPPPHNKCQRLSYTEVKLYQKKRDNLNLKGWCWTYLKQLIELVIDKGKKRNTKRLF